ncbi:MAG: hypothetical protein M3R72_02745 [Bacteroidota bacterium]|nr:hypothetical protein [Bacteroidota bacterium]
MTYPLFIEIDKFDHWAQSQYRTPQDDMVGEWECDYENWKNIYAAFEEFLNKKNSNQWNNKEKERLLYIIARDNEMEILANTLSEQDLAILAKYSIKNGHINDKWQLAVNIYKITNKQLAENILEAFVNDECEYVSRRALMELAKINSIKVEYYAELFWNRNKYNDMNEYQKIVVLFSLKEIYSKQLDKYIQLAKEDGRQFLVEYAIKMEHE